MRRPRPCPTSSLIRGAPALLSLILALGSCAGFGRGAANAPPGPPDRTATKSEPAPPPSPGEELAKRLFLVDTHIDYPTARRGSQDPARWTSGHFDHPRAVIGGLDLAFMSLFVSQDEVDAGTGPARLEELLTFIESLPEQNPALFALARSPEEARAARDSGRLGLGLGLENAGALEGRIERIGELKRRGVAYAGLVHARDNDLADAAVIGTGPGRWGGLSPLGREVLKELNRQGILVDVSHLSDEAFWEVLRLSESPVIASHSGCRTFTPGLARNLSDEMLAALGRSGGLVMIPFGSYFIKDEYRLNGRPLATVAELAAVIDHAVRTAGLDHVGLGSDFDGVGASLPVGLSDVSMYPALADRLIHMGYGEAELEKILGGNFLRLWEEISSRTRR